MALQSRFVLRGLPLTPLRDADLASHPIDEHELAQCSLPPTSETALPTAVLPTPSDLRAVRRILAQCGLPAELVFSILHEAAYYAAVRSTLRDWDPAPYDGEDNDGDDVAGDDDYSDDEGDITYGNNDDIDDTTDNTRSEHGSDTHPNNHAPDNHSASHSELDVDVGTPLVIEAGLGCVKPDGGNCAARLCVLTPPLPRGAPGETWRAKAVVWDVEGHDQGWGGERPGTFDGAFSWYEATIIRPTSSDADAVSNHAGRTLASCWDTLNRPYCSPETARPVLTSLGYTFVEAGGDSGPAWFVQRNRVARGEFARYHIEWSTDDPLAVLPPGSGSGAGFLEALRPGDVVALWMRAMYPGWANFLRAATVKILYDVY